jgi:3-phenylpropionate/trans-cinnamate dioxygenase ferredoxin component
MVNQVMTEKTNQMVAVAPLESLVEGSPVRVEIDGTPVVLIRIADTVYGLQDRCSHQDVPLSEGSIWADDLEIECHRHGSTFSLVTGEAQCLPATRPVPIYRAMIEDGTVYLDVEEEK